MTLSQALFQSRGTLEAGRVYWMAALSLLAFYAIFYAAYSALILKAEGPAGYALALLFGSAFYGFLYPYFCLYGKRLRDAGVNPIWFIAIVIVYGVVTMVIFFILLMPKLFGDDGLIALVMNSLTEIYTEAYHKSSNAGFSGGLETQFEFQKMIMQVTLIPSLIASLCTSLFCDMGVSLLKSKPEGEKYAEPGSYLDTF